MVYYRLRAGVTDRSESTMRTRLERGEFPGAYKLEGKQWRIPRAAVRAFRESERESEVRRTLAGGAEPVSLGDWKGQMSS
jgi:hypothetical protein